jgi:phage terminase large subunit-like protein
MHALWRFWIPEEALRDLDKNNDNKWTNWAKQGWIKVTDGNVVDYDTIYADIEKDAQDFFISAGDADQWSMAPVIQEVEKRTGVEELVAYSNTYARMTPGLNEVMAFVKAKTLQHHGNPVARSCFDSAEVRKAPYDSELIRVDKPDRTPTAARIDAVPALALAASAWRRSTGEDEGSGWMMSL